MLQSIECSLATAQDLQPPNPRLLDFLCEREQLLELVRIALGPVQPAEPDVDAYKLPYAACEVLCSEVRPPRPSQQPSHQLLAGKLRSRPLCLQSDQVLDGITSQNGLLESLFEYPGSEEPLDAVTSTFFARIVTHIVRSRAASVLGWLQVEAL